MRAAKTGCLTGLVICFFSGILWLAAVRPTGVSTSPPSGTGFLDTQRADPPANAGQPSVPAPQPTKDLDTATADTPSFASQTVGAQLNGSLRGWTASVATDTATHSGLHAEPALPYGQDVACLPTVFGYARQQADILFQVNKTFAQCCSEPQTILRYHAAGVFEGSLEANCSGESSFVAVGLRRKDERLGNVKYELSWNPYSIPIDIRGTEYAFVRCGRSQAEGLLVNRFNATAAKRAKITTEAIQKEVNASAEARPLAVYLIVFDSVSRLHFYRSFPSTIALLNDTKKAGQYSMFDFEVNNAAGINTAPNMIPLLFGHDLAAHKLLTQNASLNRESDESKFTQSQSSSIWQHFERLGFVTLFGYDSVWDYLTQYIGRVVTTDHMVANFYRAAKVVFGYEDSMKTARCLGCSHAHDFLLDYLRQYNDNYRGYNRFAYIHLSPGHEATGTVIRTADADLKKFLQAVLDAQRKRSDEDFVIMLTSDHGKHIGIDASYEAFVENQLPFHLVIAGDGLLARLGPDTRSVLERNSKRLVSRYDWHLTLKHLATVPYGQLAADSQLYQAWKQKSAAQSAVSLLMEPIPDSRYCNHVGIPLFFCACLDFRAVGDEHLSEFPIRDIAALGVSFMNFQLNLAGATDICQQLSLKDVTRVLVKDIAPDVSWYFKVRLTVAQSTSAVFDVIALAATEDQFSVYSQGEDEAHPTLVVTNADGGRLKLQLSEVVRVDEYSGFCEELSKVIAANPQYCLCALPLPDSDPMPGTLASATETLLSRMQVVLAPKGIPCEWACKQANRECVAWGFHLINSQYVLKQPYRDKNSYEILMQTEKTRTTFKALDVRATFRQGSGVRLMRVMYEDAYNLYLDDLSKPPRCLEKPPTANMLCPCI